MILIFIHIFFLGWCEMGLYLDLAKDCMMEFIQTLILTLGILKNKINSNYFIISCILIQFTIFNQ